MRIGLDCSGEGCEYVLAAGVSSDALTLAPALSTLLAELAVEESADLLAGALAADPDLAGEVASVVLQLAEIHEEIGIPESCSCLLTSGVTQAPFLGRKRPGPGDQTPTNLQTVSGREGPGAFHSVVARIDEGTMDIDSAGSTRFDLDLQCWKLRGWDPGGLELDLPGVATPVAIRVPILTSCDEGCTSTAYHAVTYTAQIHGAVAACDQYPDGVFAQATIAEYDDYLYRRSAGLPLALRGGPPVVRRLRQLPEEE